jgi:prepilin-type processing-associated H-X9-DG protein
MSSFEPRKESMRLGARGGRLAFTLIDILVVIAVVAILGAVLLPAWTRSKQKAHDTACLSNLKQLGRALQMYIDDNEGHLPGPLWSGMQASADATSSEEFLYYTAPYLGVPPLTEQAAVIPAAACPGYMNAAPGIRYVRDMEGRICYLLNPGFGSAQGPPVRPFGYPKPSQPPLERSQLSHYGPPAELFAISDADKRNVTDPSVSWWPDLPSKPVHGATRNQLFFDGHAAAVRVATEIVRK